MGDMRYDNGAGENRVEGDKVVYSAAASQSRRTPESRPDRPVVLLMSANADRQQALRIDEERREIAQVVRLAGDRLEVRTADALRLDDLQAELLRHRPAIVHFSGHGTADDGIAVMDDAGETRSVAPYALRNLFGLLRGGLRCVVLNACFTEVQARAIGVHVPHVVGVSGPLLDEAAIRFAAGFYRGVAHGEPIPTSFEFGRNSVELHGCQGADAFRILVAADAPHTALVGPVSSDPVALRPSVHQAAVDVHGRVTGLEARSSSGVPGVEVDQNFRTINSGAEVIGISFDDRHSRSSGSGHGPED